MNFAAFDLNLLRVFDALMRERSVTRAGEQIGLSQPAVSQALTRLRGLIDDQLFVRRGAEMAPTPRAEALAPAVREALSGLERALIGDRRFEPAEAERTYTILGADFFSTLLMPDLYRRVAAEAPRVRLRLVDTAWGDVEKLLQDDAIDLALERPLTVADWISCEIILVSPFAVIARKDHAGMKAAGARPGEPAPLDAFCEAPHALRSIDGSLTGWTDEALAQIGRSRRVMLTVPHFIAVAEAVARNDLVAVVPSQFAKAVADRLELAVYQPPVAFGVPDVRMYWHARHDKNPAHRWMRDLIRELVTRLGS